MSMSCSLNSIKFYVSIEQKTTYERQREWFKAIRETNTAAGMVRKEEWSTMRHHLGFFNEARMTSSCVLQDSGCCVAVHKRGTM